MARQSMFARVSTEVIELINSTTAASAKTKWRPGFFWVEISHMAQTYYAISLIDRQFNRNLSIVCTVLLCFEGVRVDLCLLSRLH